MSIICYVLRVTGDVIAQIEHDEQLADGATLRAVIDHADAEFEARISHLSDTERVSSRKRRSEARAHANDRLPPSAKEILTQQHVHAERARALSLSPAICLERSWNELEHVFDEFGVSIFEGKPVGRNGGYGEPLLRDPTETKALYQVLNSTGVAAIQNLNAEKLRAELYGWMNAKERESLPSDDALRAGITHYFTILRDYVAATADADEGLLVWAS